jgi:putative tricarboxylic transport membrane protein
VFGVAIALSALLKEGPELEKWRWRGPVFVCGGILAFGATIRTVGLALAGPLVMIIGGMASPDSKWKELVLFAIAVTALCIVLFRYVLGLSIPVLTIPGVLTV